jgi:hypothetical protein
VGPVLHAAAGRENFAQTKDFGAMGSTEFCNVRVYAVSVPWKGARRTPLSNRRRLGCLSATFWPNG